MKTMKDVSGARYGRVTILNRCGVRVHPKGQRRSLIFGRCDCGVEKVFQLADLTSGNTKSCGCLRRDLGRTFLAPLGNPTAAHLANTTHGEAVHKARSPEYRTWRSVITRCTNPKMNGWKYYGGRGITMCPEWRESFEAFLSHVGRKPTPKHSLDRYPDNSAGYFPGNVRWATAKEQAANRRPRG